MCGVMCDMLMKVNDVSDNIPAGIIKIAGQSLPVFAVQQDVNGSFIFST